MDDVMMEMGRYQIFELDSYPYDILLADILAVTGDGSSGECSKLNQPSWLFGAL